jgi:hypothetical protein
VADGVVGGDPAAPGAWPDAVAILYGGAPGCTGTVVAPDAVLTAGHCGPEASSVVVAGRDEIAVETAIVRPDPLGDLDVAVLLLARPAAVPVRGLVRGCLSDRLGEGADVVIAGFGATSPGGAPTGVLHTAWTTVTADACDTCRPGELVVGGAGVDTCAGDSGGPLYLPVEGDFWLAGLATRGLPDQPCGAGGIFLRSDEVADWVEDAAGHPLPPPPCASGAGGCTVAPGASALGAMIGFALIVSRSRAWSSAS